MRNRVLLAFLFLLVCCKKSQAIQADVGSEEQPVSAESEAIEASEASEASEAIIDDTESLEFVDYPNIAATYRVCEGKTPSNLPCPFTLKRTLDYQAGFITEERCQCFPEVSSRSAPIDETQKNRFRALIKNISPLEWANGCSSDLGPTELTIKKPDTVQKVYFSRGDLKNCEGNANYVKAAAPQSLSEAIAMDLQSATLLTERKLRKIYGDHKGFKLVFPMPDPELFPQCAVKISYVYKTETQQLDVETCDINQGMLLRTVPLTATDNERLLNALKAIEVPTMDSRMLRCSRTGVLLDIYRTDGSPESYEFDGPNCDDDWKAKYEFRRQIYSPSAEEFLKLILPI